MAIVWRDLGPYPDRVELLRQMDPYALLEVPRDVTPQALREAYLRKVKLYHPDVLHPFVAAHGEEVVKVLNEAYDLLRERTGGPRPADG